MLGLFLVLFVFDCRYSEFDAQRSIAKKDKDAADHYVKEAHAWSQQLTSEGERFGHSVMDVIEGKRTSAAAKTEIEKLARLLEAKQNYFKSKSSRAAAAKVLVGSMATSAAR